jgi:hypothetical protein
VTPESLHTVDINGEIVRRGSGIEGVTDHGVLLAVCEPVTNCPTFGLYFRALEICVSMKGINEE